MVTMTLAATRHIGGRLGVIPASASRSMGIAMMALLHSGEACTITNSGAQGPAGRYEGRPGTVPVRELAVSGVPVGGDVVVEEPQLLAGFQSVRTPRHRYRSSVHAVGTGDVIVTVAGVNGGWLGGVVLVVMGGELVTGLVSVAVVVTTSVGEWPEMSGSDRT